MAEQKVSRYHNQDNFKVVNTPKGPLMVVKGIDPEDDRSNIAYSSIFQHDDYYLEPRILKSFDNESERDFEYETLTQEQADLFFNTLLEQVEAVSDQLG